MGKYSKIDPGGTYSPDNDPTRAESLAQRILDCYPDAAVTRTRDVIQMDLNGEEGCVVLVTAEGLELRLPTIEWTHGSYGPRCSSRLWKRVKADDISDKRLRSLIESAVKARQDEFQACCYCRKRFPPEHMTDDACHGCSERYRGINY